MSLVSLSIDRCTLGAIAAFFGAGKARLTFFAARGFLTAAMGAGAFVDFAAFFAVAMRNFLHEKSLVRRTDIGSDSEIVQQLAMKIVRALPRLNICSRWQVRTHAINNEPTARRPWSTEKRIEWQTR